MSTQYVERTVALIRNIEWHELLPHAIRLLSSGDPVPLERLAAAAESPLADVEASIGKHRNVERDDDGNLVGFGLTLRPTPHRFTVEGRTLFTWCADDTLLFTVILGRRALVESTCPQTKQRTRIELTPDGVERVDPPGAVVSAVRLADPCCIVDLRAETCDRGHFFSSLAAANPWADAHPQGELHAVEEAFRLDREVIEQLGWAAPRGRP